MSRLDLLLPWLLRAFLAAGWLSVIVLAAHGSVALDCPLPLAIAVRVLGFGMLVFFTTSIAAGAIDGSV